MILTVYIRDVVSGTTRTVEFSQSPVRIGRNQLNDLPFEDPFVSEWHGTIRFDATGPAYFDLGSTNGTLLDGKRLPKNVAAPLTPQSRLAIGRREVTVSMPPAPMPPPRPPGSDDGTRKTIGLGQPLPAAMFPPTAGSIRVPSGRVPSGRGFPAVPAAPTPSGPAPGAPRATAPIPEAPLAKLLEAFTEAFIGLRKGFEQFGAEVGVRTLNGSTPLHRAQSAEELRGHLLDPSVDAAASSRELISIFADFGIHHIAMMEGITESVRALLQSLDPRAFELQSAGGLFSGSKKAKAQWTEYLEQFDQLVTNDEQLHAAIFGDDFARAYASVTQGDGRTADDGQDGDDG